MKANSLIVGLAALSLAANLAHAVPLITSCPPGGCWTKTNKAACAPATWETWAIDGTACRDYTPAEATAELATFDGLFKGHYTYISACTWTYNCHAYVFDASGSWGGDPANFLGAANPCYMVANGPIYRWGASHSSFAGPDPAKRPYNGKCGQGPKCDHDDFIYGAHTDRWQQRPKS